MPKRLNSLSPLLRLFISQYDLSRKHLFIMLFMPIVLAMASSYVVTNYLVDKKAQEVGEFNLKRLEHLLRQSETIGEYATTLSE
ncbi:MAG: EAL domain-containing protein, partial [Shewanella sp.]